MALFDVKLTCCGRDDGFYGPVSWAEADSFRESYLSGVASYAGPKDLTKDGHYRSAIIVAHEPAILEGKS